MTDVLILQQLEQLCGQCQGQSSKMETVLIALGHLGRLEEEKKVSLNSNIIVSTNVCIL